jgi:membrane associated rhomboid family serine protease
MRYDTRYRSSSSLFNWSFPTGVKWLVIVNVAVFLIDFFASRVLHIGSLHDALLLELVPAAVIHGMVWQLVTYLFVHDTGTLWHILFNMLSLWMFGAPVEEAWGTRRFLQYYFVCGVGAGICVVLVDLLIGHPYLRTIGASGAIYGVLLAFGMLFPNQTVLMSFLFPIKAKYMVMIFGAIAFLSSFQTDSPVSNLAHLGGMIFGFVYIRTQFRSRAGSGFRLDLAQRWKEYRLQRARRKFRVYLKKHGSDRDPWVN